ncbi:hypothetical protein RB195_014501 [Necator americanus]|uniref:Globin domain-containing protein n=1 Tax=Necator americanus TaxID=51031 RepID=A0ABR1E1M3_NECAM
MRQRIRLQLRFLASQYYNHRGQLWYQFVNPVGMERTESKQKNGGTGKNGSRAINSRYQIAKMRKTAKLLSALTELVELKQETLLTFYFLFNIMGNTESSDSLSLKHRPRSQSPPKALGGSVRSRPETARRCMTECPARRSKTCHRRHPRKKAVCSVTGLTLHQKALLTRKWNRMETATAYELGRRTFEMIFTENPHYLAYIDLKGEPNWRHHINFRIHVQRFVTAMSEAMRRLGDPSTSYDVLRDFGASYASYPKRVSAVYFERLANALNQTATQLQEHDHLSLEKAPSREEDSISSEGDKSFKSLLDVEKLSALDELTGSASCSSFSVPRQRFASRASLTHIDSHSECLDHGPNDICPITVEAWTVLSAYLANQIKYGYEMERLIRTEMSKLGLDGSGGLKRGTLTMQRPTQFA